VPCASKRAGLVLASGINARFTQLNNTIIPTVIKHTAAPGIYKIVGTLPVCTENLNPNVAVMKPCPFRKSHSDVLVMQPGQNGDGV